jgi:hypothetical protein
METKTYRRFQKAILKSSVGKTYEEIVKEYVLIDFHYCNTFEHDCICGKNIKKVFLYKNIENKKIIKTGCVCSDNFFQDKENKKKLIKENTCSKDKCKKYIDSKLKGYNIHFCKDCFLDIFGSKIVPFGKHRGKEFWIIPRYKSYSKWILTQKSSDPLFRHLKIYIKFLRHHKI